MGVVGVFAGEVAFAQDVEKQEGRATRVRTDSTSQLLSRRVEPTSYGEVLAGLKVMLVTAKNTLLKLIEYLKGGVSQPSGQPTAVGRDEVDVRGRQGLARSISLPAGQSNAVWYNEANDPACRRGIKPGLTRSVSALGMFGGVAQLTGWKLAGHVIRQNGLGAPIEALERLEKGGSKDLQSQAKKLLNSNVEGLPLRQWKSCDKGLNKWLGEATMDDRDKAAATLKELAGQIDALRDKEMVKRGAIPSLIKEQLEGLRPGANNPLLSHLSDSADVRISDAELESLKMAVDKRTLLVGQIEGQLKTQGDLDRVRRALGLNEPLAP